MDQTKLIGALNGLVTLNTALLYLLDQENILPRAKTISTLQWWIANASAEAKANGSLLPFQLVLSNLQNPSPDGPSWTPTVIPGGKDQER